MFLVNQVIGWVGTYEDVENPKHEWRVPGEMTENATYYDMDTPKLLNTDM